MTQPGSQPDGSAPLNRRDLLRLGAASLGVPLLIPSTTPLAAADRPAQVNAEATPLSDFPVSWEGEDYPGHPDPRARTVNNLKFMGLAMHNFTAMNGGRFPAAAIRKGDKALLSWRVAILPFLEQFALYERFHLDEAWDSPHNASLLKEMPRVYAPVAHKDTTPYATLLSRVRRPGVAVRWGRRHEDRGRHRRGKADPDDRRGGRTGPLDEARGPALRRWEAVAETRRANSRTGPMWPSPMAPYGSSAGGSLPKHSAPSSRSGDGKVFPFDKLGPSDGFVRAPSIATPRLLAGQIGDEETPHTWNASSTDQTYRSSRQVRQRACCNCITVICRSGSTASQTA